MYNTVYRGQFLNKEVQPDLTPIQQLITIDIFDTESGVAAVPIAVYELEMAETPLTISVINNGESKYGLLSKQCEIRCHTTNNIRAYTFAVGGDNRWMVRIYSPVETIFIGFLSIADTRQLFQPDPNILTLTGTDGIGFLKDEPLVNYDGDTPKDYHKIIDYLIWSFARTGLSLPIYAVFNIRESTADNLDDDTDGSGHFFIHENLDAKTFETEIGECEDCNSVLTKIFKAECFAIQHNGAWWIVRVDEIQYADSYKIARFDEDGNWMQYFEATYAKYIGFGLPMSFMNEDAEVSYERPYKSVILRFNYQYPKELVCNSDFSRGEGDPVTGVEDETIEYVPECWTMDRRSGGITSTVRIDKNFEYGYEKSRYLVVTPKDSTATPWDFAKSSAMVVAEGDKINVSVSHKRPNNYGGGNHWIYPMRIWLEGFDGSLWEWWNASTTTDASTFYWYSVVSLGERNIPDNWVADDYNETEWRQLSVNLNALPVSGKLYIGLNQGRQDPSISATNQDIYFSDLQIDVTPFIIGSYQRYEAQQHTVTQPIEPEKLKAVLNEEVFISDAPRIAMKGALLKYDGTNHILTDGFYNAAVFPGGVPDETYIKPFGEMQSLDVWNQFNRIMRKFEGVVDGLTSNVSLPDSIFKVFLADISQDTNNKIFQLLHFEKNVDLCEWQLFVHEVHDSTIDKQYTGHDFKYITGNG